MKYAIVLPAGAADEPLDQLDGRTPLEAARTPNIDAVAVNGRQGRVLTTPSGCTPDGDVGVLTILGYDVRSDCPGRGPIEAAARRIPVRAGQLVFRCNLVTITDGRMEDHTAGRISQAEADRLIADLNECLSDRRCQFHSGLAHRALAVVSDIPDLNPQCTPPHDIPGRLVSEHLPRGPGADWLRGVMDRAREILADHDVNHVRRDLGENPATDLWPWGPGKFRRLGRFADRFGVTGAVIGGVDLIRGIARLASVETIDVPTATGDVDTDYAGKGAAAAGAVTSFDLVIVHIQAPDAASHRGDVDAKIAAIEQIDQHVVGPLLDTLRTHDRWRILIAPGHAASVARRVHERTPVPFCFAGQGVHSVLQQPFSERTAAMSDLQVDPGRELLEYVLRS